MEQFPELFVRPIFHTSRAPRAGEENGVQFYFVQKSDIENAINKNEVIDHYLDKNTIYALKISTIDEIRKKNKICVIDLDIKFLNLVKQSMLVVKYIFISPTTIQSLDTRLKDLSIETLPKIASRIALAKKELELAQADENIDKIIINDNLDQCINRLIYQLDGWYPEFNFHENDQLDI